MYSPVRNHMCHERLFNFANRPTREYFEREGIDEAGGTRLLQHMIGPSNSLEERKPLK